MTIIQQIKTNIESLEHAIYNTTMKDLRRHIKQYLEAARVMQLATSVNDKPWVCNVHFYSDSDLNIYWMSAPLRRHSKDIERNQHVAAAVKIHEDTPDELYIIGLTVEGKAELLSEEKTDKIGKLYIEKLGKPPILLEEMRTGKNPNKIYKLTPTCFVLFDTKNFPDDPRQEYSL